MKLFPISPVFDFMPFLYSRNAKSSMVPRLQSIANKGVFICDGLQWYIEMKLLMNVTMLFEKSLMLFCSK
ncbi:hypothetical protein D3C87_1442820 [compost metagenome]